MSTKKSDAVRYLEKVTGGPVTLGRFLEAVRLGEELTQPAFAKKLGLSKSHLNDIEKGRSGEPRSRCSIRQDLGLRRGAAGQACTPGPNPISHLR